MPEIIGEIETDGDVDVFTQLLLAGVRYAIELEGVATDAGTLSDPFLTILRDGEVFRSSDDEGEGNNARIWLVPQSDLSLDFEVSGFAGSTGTYRLRIFEDDYRNTVEGAGPELTVPGGRWAEGTINYAGDADVFRAMLIAELTYTFLVLGEDSGAGTLPDPFLELFDSGGGLIESADNGAGGLDAGGEFTATSTDWHYLRASGAADDEGSYTLFVSLGRGTGGPDEIFGTGQDDAINGKGGNDTILGGSGRDRLLGGFGFDFLSGGLGDDLLAGEPGRDTLRGNDGFDRLTGGAQSDILIGGLQGDVFAFLSTSDSRPVGRDVIRAGNGATAFQGAGASWGDSVDLSSIDANAATAAHDALVFGTARGIGRVWAEDVGTNTVMRANTGSGPAPEFELVIEDDAVRAANYAAADFILA